MKLYFPYFLTRTWTEHSINYFSLCTITTLRRLVIFIQILFINWYDAIPITKLLSRDVYLLFSQIQKQEWKVNSAQTKKKNPDNGPFTRYIVRLINMLSTYPDG